MIPTKYLGLCLVPAKEKKTIATSFSTATESMSFKLKKLESNLTNRILSLSKDPF
jgi:hypothetical protein